MQLFWLHPHKRQGGSLFMCAFGYWQLNTCMMSVVFVVGCWINWFYDLLTYFYAFIEIHKKMSIDVLMNFWFMISIMKSLKNWCLMNGNETRLINLLSVKGADLGEISGLWWRLVVMVFWCTVDGLPPLSPFKVSHR